MGAYTYDSITNFCCCFNLNNLPFTRQNQSHVKTKYCKKKKKSTTQESRQISRAFYPPNIAMPLLHHAVAYWLMWVHLNSWIQQKRLEFYSQFCARVDGLISFEDLLSSLSGAF